MNPFLATGLRLLFTYVFFLILLRIAGKRIVSMGQTGSHEKLVVGTPFDFVVALIISDMPDDVIFGEIPVARGVIAVSTLLALHLFVSYLSMRVPQFHRLVAGKPDPVLFKDRLDEKSMARQRLSQMELDMQLREYQIDDRSEVQEAWLEPTSKLSIKRYEEAKPAKRSDLKDGREARQ